MAINLSTHFITVTKHGSHNQSSHGRGGGASGGSGGGASQAPKPNEDKLVEAAEALDNNIVGATRVLNNAKNAEDANMARGAVQGFKDVKAALGDKEKMDRVRLKRNSKAAQTMLNIAPLQEGYRENVGYVNATTGALAIYGNL